VTVAAFLPAGQGRTTAAVEGLCAKESHGHKLVTQSRIVFMNYGMQRSFIPLFMLRRAFQALVAVSMP
jgi:hypothetical protein